MANIIYFDKYICVCDKPRGYLSEGEGNDCLPSLLRDDLASKGASASDIYTVHRLDRETEGLMVYALTKQAAAALSADISDGRLEKEYYATLCKAPAEPTGELDDLLFYDRTKNRSYIVKRERKGVKRARLSYKTVRELDGGRVVVRVRLHTGRTHQIRAQFSALGCPLVGDRRYGAPKTDESIALVSCRLCFLHPITKKIMEFEKDLENGEISVHSGE